MKRIVLTYGLISGGILAAMIGVSIPACMNGTLDFKYAEIVGYTSMILAYVAVFLGIRNYREKHGGTITFGKAFQVGILITLVTCAIYVTVWEIMYFGFLPDFGDKFAAYTIDKMRAGGASDAALLKAQQEMARFKVLYKNPLFNVGMTFIEVFPVGLIVTLVSAAILRKKGPSAPEPAAAAIA